MMSALGKASPNLWGCHLRRFRVEFLLDGQTHADLARTKTVSATNREDAIEVAWFLIRADGPELLADAGGKWVTMELFADDQ